MDSLLEYSGHIAYTLIFFSFMVRKIIWLRALAIIASVTSIVFNYSAPAEPLWTPIYWNCLFILTNSWQITKILMDRRHVRLKDWQSKMYQSAFSEMTPGEFRRVISFGFLRTGHPGESLIKENENMDALFFVVSGGTSVLKNGLEVASLGEGEFLGEMSFITGEKTKADVYFKSKTSYFFWESQKLKAYLLQNPTVYSNFHAILDKQLINQIIKSADNAAVNLGEHKKAA